MESIDLAHRLLGGADTAPPVVLLHGLLGSSRNWLSAGRLLADFNRVYALDLRNHGESPHDRRMDYPTLAGDVIHWMDLNGLGKVHIIGHSMGGKVAMYLAVHYPGRINSLTVVDIAPRAYPPRWEKEFAIMRRMPVHHFSRRQEAEEWLSTEISDWAFRKFLVSNLERIETGGFRWVVNLRILEASLPNLFEQIPKKGEGYGGKVLFMRGQRSRFISDADAAIIEGFFPLMKLVTVEDAGHNVHFDQPERFAGIIRVHFS